MRAGQLPSLIRALSGGAGPGPVPRRPPRGAVVRPRSAPPPQHGSGAAGPTRVRGPSRGSVGAAWVSPRAHAASGAGSGVFIFIIIIFYPPPHAGAHGASAAGSPPGGRQGGARGWGPRPHAGHLPPVGLPAAGCWARAFPRGSASSCGLAGGG